MNIYSESMTDKEFENMKEGQMTIPMDIGSEGFKDFQRFIKSKAESRTKEEKIFVEQMSLRFQIESYLREENSKLITIGSFLKMFLKNTGIKQTTLSKYIGVKPPNFTKLLTGERRINLEVALMLQNIIGVDASSILAVQTKSELLGVGKREKNRLLKFSIRDLLVKQRNDK